MVVVTMQIYVVDEFRPGEFPTGFDVKTAVALLISICVSLV